MTSTALLLMHAHGTADECRVDTCLYGTREERSSTVSSLLSGLSDALFRPSCGKARSLHAWIGRVGAGAETFDRGADVVLALGEANAWHVARDVLLAACEADGPDRTSPSHPSPASRSRRHLVIAGLAGRGVAIDGWYVSLPSTEDVLVETLAAAGRHERACVSGDRNEAACLAAMDRAAIAAIPDRPGGLRFWLVDVGGDDARARRAEVVSALEEGAPADMTLSLEVIEGNDAMAARCVVSLVRNRDFP